jgi:hypothetical protein
MHPIPTMIEYAVIVAYQEKENKNQAWRHSEVGDEFIIKQTNLWMTETYFPS